MVIGMTNGAVAIMDDGLERVLTSWQHTRGLITGTTIASSS